MSDGDSFVDTRLYVTLRPALEYLMVETGQHAISVMLGDEVSDYRFLDVSDCTNPPKSLTSMTDPLLAPLVNLCMSVCSMTDDYLQTMETEWIEFLTRIHTGLRNEIGTLRRRMDDVVRIRRRYGELRNAEIDGEISTEMHRLGEHMDEVLSRYRTAEHPTTRRSDDLIEATHKLRREFGNMYGEVPTHSLTHLRTVFDSEMQSIQRCVSQSFNRRLRNLCSRRI